MSKLYIKQKVFSLGGKFTVKNELEQDKYFVEGSFLSIPKIFTISDRFGSTVATITKKVFSFLPKFFVDLPDKEQVVIAKELTFLKARYQIQGQGLTVQGDWINMNFEVFKDNQKVATVNEKWFTWGDTYEVLVEDESLEHTIISLVIAIDFVKQQEANSSSSS